MTERRGLLKIVGGLIATGLGLVVGIPAGLFLSFPARRRRAVDEIVEVADLARLPDGQPVRVPVIARRRLDAWTAFLDVTLGAVWLVRQGERVRALSTVCPHTGCSVDWDAAAGAFACPCHDSRFGLDGARRSGPAPRDMDPLDAEVDNGRVRLTYRRFRPGVPGREPT
jgi:Rieske Fe-S protein